MVQFFKNLFKDPSIERNLINEALLTTFTSVSEKFFKNLEISSVRESGDSDNKVYKIYRNFLGRDYFKGERLKELQDLTITAEITTGTNTPPIYSIILHNKHRNKEFKIFSNHTFTKLIFNSNKLVNKKLLKPEQEELLIGQEKHFIFVNEKQILTAKDINFIPHTLAQKIIKDIKNKYSKDILKAILKKIYSVDNDVLNCVDEIEDTKNIKKYTEILLHKSPQKIERKDIIELLKCNLDIKELSNV